MKILNSLKILPHKILKPAWTAAKSVILWKTGNAGVPASGQLPYRGGHNQHGWRCLHTHRYVSSSMHCPTHQFLRGWLHAAAAASALAAACPPSSGISTASRAVSASAAVAAGSTGGAANGRPCRTCCDAWPCRCGCAGAQGAALYRQLQRSAAHHITAPILLLPLPVRLRVKVHPPPPPSGLPTPVPPTPAPESTHCRRHHPGMWGRR